MKSDKKSFSAHTGSGKEISLPILRGMFINADSLEMGDYEEFDLVDFNLIIDIPTIESTGRQ